MLQSGQTTLDNPNAHQKRSNGVIDVEDDPHDDQSPPLEVRANGHSQGEPQLASPQTNGNNNLIFQHYQPNGDAHQSGPQDIEMGWSFAPPKLVLYTKGRL